MESEIDAKKSQASMLEDKLAQLDREAEKYEELVESLAEVVSSGGDVRGSPNFEEAVDISGKSAEDVMTDIENRAGNKAETDELDVSVRDEYDF